MPVLHVEAVPADLYERIQRRAAARNQDFTAEVLNLLELALGDEENARTMHVAALADLQRRRWAPLDAASRLAGQHRPPTRGP
jgi:plasmid stability protein